MSGMVISSIENFINMTGLLKDIGISNIHFYSSKSQGTSYTPMMALVPFVDFLILGNDAPDLPSLDRVVFEARTRHIPVLKQECLHSIASIDGTGCR